METEKDEYLYLTNDPFADLAASILRRHIRAKFDTLKTGFWDTWKSVNVCLYLAVSFSFPIILDEPGVWLNDWSHSFPDISFLNHLLAALLLLCPLNGFLLDRFLAGQTSDETRFPRWARGLRLLLASLPIYSISAISFWKWYLERKQAEPLSSESRGSRLDLFQSRARLTMRPSLLRRIHDTGFFFNILILHGITTLFVINGWLMSASLGPHRPLLILGYFASLHLVACTLMIHYSATRLRSSHISKKRRLLYWIVPLLLLLGLPGYLAGMILFAWLETPHKTLVWYLHDRRTGTGRMYLWQSLQGPLLRRWQTRPWFVQWRRPKGLVSEDRAESANPQITSFHRLKALVMILEGAAFFTLCTILAVHLPSLTHIMSRVVRSAAIGAIILASSGLLIQTTVLLARVLKIQSWADNLTLHPYGRYLMLTQAAFLAGLEGAYLVREGRINYFGFLLGMGGLSCMMLSLLMFNSPTRGIVRGRDALLWCFFFASLMGLGLLIGADGRVHQPSLKLLRWLTVLTPLWSFGLFLALGAWLLRPFSWRHIFDWRLPLRLRAALAFVTLTGAIPIGGIAAPFWIYAHHRLWPRYERSLWDLKKTGRI